MRLTPFVQPFTQLGLETLPSELSRFFERFEGFGGFPVLEVRPEDSGLRVRAILPGVKPEDLDIEVEERTLTLRGKSFLGTWGARTEGSSDGQGTEFNRRLRLPFDVDVERAEARLEYGVLDLFLPRPAKDAPRRIEVQSGEAERLAAS